MVLMRAIVVSESVTGVLAPCALARGKSHEYPRCQSGVIVRNISGRGVVVVGGGHRPENIRGATGLYLRSSSARWSASALWAR